MQPHLGIHEPNRPIGDGDPVGHRLTRIEAIVDQPLDQRGLADAPETDQHQFRLVERPPPFARAKVIFENALRIGRLYILAVYIINCWSQ